MCQRNGIYHIRKLIEDNVKKNNQLTGKVVKQNFIENNRIWLKRNRETKWIS